VIKQLLRVDYGAIRWRGIAIFYLVRFRTCRVLRAHHTTVAR